MVCVIRDVIQAGGETTAMKFVNLDTMEQVVVRNVARFAKGHVIVTMCLGIVKKDVKVVGRELTA